MKTKLILLLAILIIKIQNVNAQAWNLNGNAGTNTTDNFIGTTDTKALKIRTNNAVRMTFATNGKIGIGTTSPAARLHIKGTATGTQFIIDAGVSQTNSEPMIRLRNSAGVDLVQIHSDDTSNIFIGVNAGKMNVPDVSGYGKYNVFIGTKAGETNNNGYWNTAIGHRAFTNNTSGFFNTACGANALSFNTTGQSNTALGGGALHRNTWGSSNTAVGEAALYSNTTAEGNTAVGAGSLVNNTTGERNSAFGYQSLIENIDGVYNTAAGYHSLKRNTHGSINTAYGHYAMYFNTTGNWNTANGHQALYNNNGTANSAFGLNALYNNTSAGNNTACGYQSLFNTTTAGGNVAVGSNANYYNNGPFNTAIGAESGCNNGTVPGNFTALGYNAGHVGSGSNSVEIGNTNVTWIGGMSNWFTYFSDRRVKDHVQNNVPGLSFITKLHPVTYTLNIHKQNEICGTNDTNQWEGKYDIEKIVQSGFIAQDVEQAAKECNYNFNGVVAPSGNRKLYSVSYSTFVIPLVKAVQELNEELTSEVKALKEEIENLKATKADSKSEVSSPKPAILYQNAPNPFNSTTEIRYSIASEFNNAQLLIYSSQGALVKAYPVLQNNPGSVTVNANTLAPGIYSYILIVDQAATDVKQMIVTK